MVVRNTLRLEEVEDAVLFPVVVVDDGLAEHEVLANHPVHFLRNGNGERV